MVSRLVIITTLFKTSPEALLAIVSKDRCKPAPTTSQELSAPKVPSLVAKVKTMAVS
jgi:hypothetical protein